ncbi:MAG: NAD(P)-dependent alcohol dehydrogenase [Clostridiales bacterium]|nr:NAD(P)-dependent alcohol dehydrogenase [Clostridiales bacterium]
MKAVVCKKYGAPEVMKIKEVNKPEVKDNDVLIKIKSSTISPVDCAFRKGNPFVSRLFTGLKRPKHIPGDIISGVIEAVGKKVTRFKVGDEVFGHTGLEFGAHSEYLASHEDEAIILKPSEMTFDEAAAVAYSAMTALPFLKDHVKIDKNTHILINGASGAIGTFAIQIAKHFGAKVTAVCGSSNIEMVKDIGADHVVDYTKDDFTTHLNSFDIIFDVVGKSSYSKSKYALKKEGVYLTTAPDFGAVIHMMTLSRLKSKKAKFVATGLRKVPQKIEDLNYLTELYKNGQINSVIDQSFVLDDIIKAHTYVDKGHSKGNVILILDQ